MRKLSCVVVVVSAIGFFAAPARAVDPSRVLGRMLAVKPSPSSLRWQQIPWANNLTEARRMAKEENRPIMLWGADDEPLDRC